MEDGLSNMEDASMANGERFVVQIFNFYPP